ncbi:MAG: hypothetical protein ACR2QK_25260, partial [Acidimicrobiales bacterium]
MTGNDLMVDFVDERFEAGPAEELTFGRAATVVIDEENEFMSRVVGSFLFHQGTWWLQNRSSTAQLTVIADSGRQAVLPPDTSEPVTAACGWIRFKSGRFNYELRFELSDPPAGPGRPASPEPGSSAAPGTPGTRATEEFGVVPLNVEQRAMLALFAKSWLEDPAAQHHEPPANAEVAHELGWSLKKLDRKLDYLCARLHDAGVQGLRGAKGGEATDRRRRLVEHVLSA